MKITVVKPEVGETALRIKRHLEIAKNASHKREICLTWDGYIAALLEWGLISPDEHSSAYELLRDNLNKDDPALAIFLAVKK